MEDDVLARIISVEKEIQGCIETEKAKARQWLDGIKKETELELLKAEERIRKAFHESLEQARDEAMAKAEILVRQEADRAGRLLELSDETLKRIIMGRVGMILPSMKP